MIVVVSPQAVGPALISSLRETSISPYRLIGGKERLTDSNGSRDLFAFHPQGLSGLGTSCRVVFQGV
jgi:hypothetical protein